MRNLTNGHAARWVVLSLLLLLPGVRSADAQARGSNPTDGQGTGFYVGAGWRSNHLSLELDERATLDSTGVTFDDWGRGPEFVVGYGFGPHFLGELALAVTRHDARPGDAEAFLVQSHFTGCVPLIAPGVLEPHLFGGCGFSVLAVIGTGFDDRFYFMVQGDMGAGVRWWLGRHLALDVDLIFSILDVEREIIGSIADSDLQFIGGTGEVFGFRLRLCHDF